MRKSIAWEDLTVEVPCLDGLNKNKKKLLLHSLTAFAYSHRIMALLGPSASGKTTLLNSLAGTLSANVTVTGNILINGNNRNFYCGEMSYVAQEEYFLGTLTVRETLTYSAQMRLVSRMTQQEISKAVQDTITEMGLQECADNQIGNWHLRGISNGEKKRLSIGLEILTQPDFLFLDEPTSGLDSASAYYVIRALRNIACGGKIVICSIHQPSSEIFHLFDDLLLLSGGETVYFGEAKMALEFFANAGFPCPTRRNPSDHFLLCINMDFEFISTSSNSPKVMKRSEIRETLIRSYKSSEPMVNARRRIQQLEEQVIESYTRRGTSSWWKQLSTLTQRSFLNMFRDIGYYWLRIIFYVLVSVSAGSLFFHIGTENNSILARGKCISFIYGFMTCLSCGGLPFFIEELKVFYGERSKGHCGVAVFVLSNILSSFPFLVLISLFSGTIIYNMVQFHSGLTHFAFFCINLFCCLSVVESCFMVVASMVPNVLMGIATGTGVIIFMMISSPIFRPLPYIPKFFWRYPMSYLSFATWAVQGHYKNDMVGLEFDPVVPGDSSVKGEEILKLVFGVPLDHDKWWDLTALITLLLLHRLLLFFVLGSKSQLLCFYAKVYLRHFAARFSPTYKPAFSS
ncbi:ABC transporter G family member 15-like [Senna tora]|uniref:ABC transporter G family member 15-like n=1 Tax=Senna tora TaxID=362788 RepID=A0A834TDH0_9FABA|nr:ABC transporter G family member 15-like [Senna tora]